MKTQFRWTIGSLLFFASMINYIDRAALPIVAPMIQKDLGIDAAQLGLIFSIFFVGYALFNFVGGTLADHFGTKKVYGIAMTVWSIFSGLTAIVTGFWQLMIFRIIFGLGEGPMGSITNKTVRNWFPRQETGVVVGMATTGGNLTGAAIAGPIMGFIALALGWRASFIVTLVIGLIWVACWLFFSADTPAKSRHVNEAERRYIESGRVAEAGQVEEGHSLGYYLSSIIILAVAFAFFAANYTQYFLLSWLPSYLVSARGLDIKTMSVVTMIPWIAGLIGVFIGGLIMDMLVRHSRHAIDARRRMLVVTLLLIAVGFGGTMMVTTTVQAVTLMALVIFIEGMIPTACWALLQDLVPGNRVGSVGGFVHLLSNIAGIVGPALTGFIIQYGGGPTGGGYNVSFAVAGGIAVLAAIGVICFIRVPAAR
mgnify:CR=1 FL=1